MFPMKHFLIALAFITVAFPAAAEKLSLDQLSNYFNELTTAEGKFRQTNGDGSVSTGTIYLRRPGRVRFEYDPPETALVITSGGQVAIFDPRADDNPTRFPVYTTPLGVILKRNVDLSDTNMVVHHYAEGPLTHLVLQDPEHLEYGRIHLTFGVQNGRVILRQWVIDDNSGYLTRVDLVSWRLGGSVPGRLFNIHTAMENWNP